MDITQNHVRSVLHYLLPEPNGRCCFPETVNLHGVTGLKEFKVDDEQRVSPDIDRKAVDTVVSEEMASY